MKTEAVKVNGKMENQWEAEDAARTLVKAEEIKKDPKLLARALRELRKQKQAAASALADVSKNK